MAGTQKIWQNKKKRLSVFYILLGFVKHIKYKITSFKLIGMKNKDLYSETVYLYTKPEVLID